jgi:hypothetical protein
VWARVIALTLMAAAAPAAAQTPDPPPTPPSQPAPAPDPPPKPWWERLTIYGDFRARYEGFFQDDHEDRHRQRIRFRLGVRTSIAEGLDLNVRITSGEAADVASTNQSLGEFLSRKPINIDQASLVYTPRPFTRLSLGFGKYAYPVTRTQLVWDDDVNWEGTYQSLTLRSGDPVALRIVGVQSPINEVAAAADAYLFGEYVEARIKVGRQDVQLSIADYAFTQVDQIAVALDRGTTLRAQNSNALRRDTAGRVVGFRSGFNVVDAIGQVTVPTARRDYPLTFLAELASNTRATADAGTGVWLVGTYGKASATGTFSAGYTYAHVERDAVISAYNFSDMTPATNVVMHMAGFSFKPQGRINLDATAIVTRLLDTDAPNPYLFRLQIDARVAF